MAREINPRTLEAIAQRLIWTREALELSQAAFARRCGLKANALNNYERQRERIALDQAFKIKAATGATLDWIYDGEMANLPNDLATRIQAVMTKGKPTPRRKAS